jgi:hypothetical protein
MSKKIIVYPDNSLCIEGRICAAPQGFLEKYGISPVRVKTTRSRARGAEIIKREDYLFVCHFQPEAKGPQRHPMTKLNNTPSLLPNAPFLGGRG